MRDTLEILATSTFACVAALFLVPLPETSGLGSAGNQGDSTVSVQASSASLEAIVDSWETSPDITETMPEMAAFEPAAPSAPPAPQADRTPQGTLPMTSVPLAPSLAAPPVTYTAPPVTDTAPPQPIRAPQTSPRPPARPPQETAQSPQTPRQSTQPNAPAAPRSEQRAAGSGEAATAGRATERDTTTLSNAKRTSLMSQWGGQIQNRIARRAPRGAGAGTAVVRLTVTGSGTLTGVNLAQSSGNAAIDRLALQAVQAAGSFPAAPTGLGAGPFSFTIPIRSR